MDAHEQGPLRSAAVGAPSTNRSREESASAILGTVAHPVNGERPSTYRLRPTTSGFRRQRAADVAALFILAIAGAIFCAAMAWHGGHLWLVAALAIVSALVLCAGEVGK